MKQERKKIERVRKNNLFPAGIRVIGENDSGSSWRFKVFSRHFSCDEDEFSASFVRSLHFDDGDRTLMERRWRQRSLEDHDMTWRVNRELIWVAPSFLSFFYVFLSNTFKTELHESCSKQFLAFIHFNLPDPAYNSN